MLALHQATYELRKNSLFPFERVLTTHSSVHRATPVWLLNNTRLGYVRRWRKVTSRRRSDMTASFASGVNTGKGETPLRETKVSAIAGGAQIFLFFL